MAQSRPGSAAVHVRLHLKPVAPTDEPEFLVALMKAIRAGKLQDVVLKQPDRETYDSLVPRWALWK